MTFQNPSYRISYEDLCAYGWLKKLTFFYLLTKMSANLWDILIIKLNFLLTIDKILIKLLLL